MSNLETLQFFAMQLNVLCMGVLIYFLIWAICAYIKLFKLKDAQFNYFRGWLIGYVFIIICELIAVSFYVILPNVKTLPSLDIIFSLIHFFPFYLLYMIFKYKLTVKIKATNIKEINYKF